MRASFWILLMALLLLGGCSTVTISPQCKFSDFARNQDLNQIPISIQVEDGREDSERYFIHWLWVRFWDTNATRFSRSQRFSLEKPSIQILQESLTNSFSDYGYNVSDESSVVLRFTLTRFLYSYSGGNPPIFAEIETSLLVQKDRQTVARRDYKNRVLHQMDVFSQYEDSEPVLSTCLTGLVRDIVTDRVLENVLRKTHGLPVQKEEIVVNPEQAPRERSAPIPTIRQPLISTGTGFAVCENGYIITANHIVEGATSISVRFQESEWVPATVVQRSSINDIAILKVDRHFQHYLIISDRVRQGERIFTLGYPVPGILGEEPKYADGTVSSLTGIVDEASLMQISVPLQPGNSGGPLLNERAEVIGMATSTAQVETFYKTTGALPQNINWGVKAAFIKPLLPADCAYEEQYNLQDMDIVEFARKAVCLVRVEKLNDGW